VKVNLARFTAAAVILASKALILGAGTWQDAIANGIRWKENVVNLRQTAWRALLALSTIASLALALGAGHRW